MITAVKKFGSYVREKVDVYDQQASETSSELSYVSTCVIPTSWTPLTLLSKRPYNHDTSIFEFALPVGYEKNSLALPVTAHLLVLAPHSQKDGSDAVRPYTSISSFEKTGSFELLVKRYDQWGQKESIGTHFLFTKTDHSYRPPGVVSNHIHRLNVGEQLCFKHNQMCIKEINYPFDGVQSITMIAVGAGVAPMIRIIRAVLEGGPSMLPFVDDLHTLSSATGSDVLKGPGTLSPALPSDSKDTARRSARPLTDERMLKEPLTDSAVSVVDGGANRISIVLLYGVRDAKDILMKEQLDEWHEMCAQESSLRFRRIYCVGSRWSNVHMCAKTKDYVKPCLENKVAHLGPEAEVGWINEEKISKWAFPPSPTTRVFVCGLPGVYDKLCGPRISPTLAKGSVLDKLGYSDSLVVKF